MTTEKLRSTDKPVSKFDPEVLRRPQDFHSRAGVKKQIISVPVSKPNRQWFVRARSEPEYRLETSVIELKEDREIYMVAPELRDDLLEDIIDVMLITSINRKNVLFLWKINLPREDGRTNEWNRTAMICAEKAQTKWLRVQSNMSLGGYEPYIAKGDLPDPEWPPLTMAQILEIAFQDHYIESVDHPVVQELYGKK